MTTKTFGLLAALLAGLAHAQAMDGGLPVAPVAANPEAKPGELVRSLDVDAGAPDAPVAAAVDAAFDADAGAPAAALATERSEAEKKEEEGAWNLSAALSGSVRASYQGATAFPLDATLQPYTIAPLLTRVRVTPEIHLGGFGLVAEADAATGAIVGAPDVTSDLPAEVPGNEGWPTTKDNLARRVPYPPIAALELRKLYLEYKWASGAFRVGQQTSNWGLGLLANDGGKDPEAGDFGQQQFGNLTYRALLAARPLFNKGGAWRAFETAFAADLIVRDNFGEFARGDRAFQGIIALRFAKDADNNLGVYVVYRNQSNIYVTDGGKKTQAFVFDFAGKWEFIKRAERSLKVGWEIVGIGGTTTQARNENASVLGVRQLGFAWKTAYRIRSTTIYLDGGFASGDQNPADDKVENFRFDRDYKVGLILFDNVLSYQTARSGARASDPNVVGVPPEGTDLLGTAGSVSGAWYLYPRVKVSVFDWFDLYGGPLFAFGTAKLTDPYNSRINGGTSLNFLGGSPGSYLGTEIDLGAQVRFHPIKELLISVTGEGGLFLPGDAFRLPDGQAMAPIGFGRLRLMVAL
ncbi:MAG: hypothetical protein AB1938_00120 [Myxococcota bacterium]